MVKEGKLNMGRKANVKSSERKHRVKTKLLGTQKARKIIEVGYDKH